MIKIIKSTVIVFPKVFAMPNIDCFKSSTAVLSENDLIARASRIH